MTADWIDLGLITDVLDVLDRHGYARSDTEHATRAILLISDLAHIYQGSQDHPFGPTASQPAPQPEPAPPPPATQNAVPVPIGEVKTLLRALDIAAECNRDRAGLCADCTGQSCPACELRLREAQIYDRLYAQLDQQAGASPTASHPEPTTQLQPAADREAGQ
jgi:hypothetical protein